MNELSIRKKQTQVINPFRDAFKAPTNSGDAYIGTAPPAGPPKLHEILSQLGCNPQVSQVAGSEPISRSGGELSTCMSLKALKSQLRGLTESELDATSVVEFRGYGAEKEYVAFHLVHDDSRKPRCPNDALPMNNRAVLTMVEALSKHYGKKADSKELAFLLGGLQQPGYTEVTMSGTGLALPFETATGHPMGKLTGSLQ